MKQDPYRHKILIVCALLTVCVLFLSAHACAQEQGKLPLPHFKSIGDLPDFHSTVSADHADVNNLRNQLGNILKRPFIEILDPRYDFETAIDHILFRYAGVEHIDPYARGPNIDARKLAIIEKMLRTSFRQKGAGGTPNPLFWAAVGLDSNYKKLQRRFYTEILIQLKGREIFDNEIGYNPRKHEFRSNEVTLNKDLIHNIMALAIELKDPVEAKKMWLRYIALIDNSMGLHALSKYDYGYLSAAITESLPGISIWSLHNTLKNYHPSQMASLTYAEDILGVSYNQALTSILKEAREKDNSQQIVIGSVIKKHLESCCDNSGDVIEYLRRFGFQVFDRTEALKKEDPNLKYTRVIAAYNTTMWQTFLGIFGWNYDQTMITVFYTDHKLDWVYGHIQRQGQTTP